MAKGEFKVRQHPQEFPNHKQAARVLLHPSTFTQGFTTAHLCTVESNGSHRDAVAWPNPDKKVATNVVLVSRVFQEAAGLDFSQMIRVTPGSGPVPDAEAVIMRETTPDAIPLPASEQVRWQYHLESRLETAEYILPGTPFEEVLLNGSKRSYVVESVNGRTDAVAKYAPGTTVAVLSSEKVNNTAGKLNVTGLPAMQRQITDLNDFFNDFEVEFDHYPKPPFSCGIVIHGSHGTGKTMFLDHIAATNWGRVIRINDDDKPLTIQTHFRDALGSWAPSIILFDDITSLIGKDQPNRAGYIRAIGKGLDTLATRARAQNRRPKVLVVATCLDFLTDIPHDLQRPGRFRDHVSLPIPDAPGRKEILRFHKPPFPSDVFDAHISDLGDRTHAYTGADLELVLERASKAWKRRVADPSKPEPLLWEDVVKGLHEVRPTAMHDINLKPPTIHWSDIGGYEDVKVALQRVIQPPKEVHENMSEPTKGILLYGPPGCSKTMTAQAMATESGFNFFAVKGGELLNMYVGETERSIRNLFKRAREASPSIIFFDEIDSIAGSRSGPGGGGGGSVQALTTLLNEMDGFERSGDVFVLAATNKPDALDPALIRPGRFDELIYVPLPDLKAREAIVASKARKLRFTPDVDVAEVARQTAGYSGAEVAKICGKAFLGVEGGGGGEDGGVATNGMEVLLAAIRKTPRGVSQELLDHFQAWSDSRVV